jgi:predicted transposase YbfD/YdcC
MVESQREIDGGITKETRFYITWLVLVANTIGPMIRDHWAAENCLHWVMDMAFATMNAACASKTTRPTSRRSSTWRRI